ARLSAGSANAGARGVASAWPGSRRSPPLSCWRRPPVAPPGSLRSPWRRSSSWTSPAEPAPSTRSGVAPGAAHLHRCGAAPDRVEDEAEAGGLAAVAVEFHASPPARVVPIPGAPRALLGQVELSYRGRRLRRIVRVEVCLVPNI